ncbi:MAG TPA: GTP cyclohydrolase I FolE [Parvibaculum sp.]|uniref:GTP cyclohydrolase I FolE n=1 Tax=Parvibaculum sp. TaxID=2024848 RepID=UPI002BEA536A|nr:GTP cyclohydrolase I FolE [Parvibaculum sp.]HMM15466.1 GTP cyclohydrolase I FolE [Parvibaculum sp.]
MAPYDERPDAGLKDFSGSFAPAGRSRAEAAIRDLLSWIGEDPDREGLAETPARVLRAYEEYFSGYAVAPEKFLATTFAETNGYDDMVALCGIGFVSHCEHHMAPFFGKAHVAYVPSGRVVGISKLARVVDAYARRLQIQERMTAEIASVIERTLKPKGVAVIIEATHHCMVARGVMKPGATLVTRRFNGIFEKDTEFRRLFEQRIEASC